MGRTKGSKNKIKETFHKEKLAKVIKKEGVEEIKNVPRKTFCECGHEKEMHYGGLKGHCNTKDCLCLEHK